ncbi:MAG: aminotransferase class IV, partial [Pseudomonadota bacterium]
MVDVTEAPPVVWANGALAPAEGAVSAFDRGFLLGDGVFETLLVRDGAPAFWNEHAQRLLRGVAALRLPAPDLDAARAALPALLAANALETGDVAARLTDDVETEPARPTPSAAAVFHD